VSGAGTAGKPRRGVVYPTVRLVEIVPTRGFEGDSLVAEVIEVTATHATVRYDARHLGGPPWTLRVSLSIGMPAFGHSWRVHRDDLPRLRMMAPTPAVEKSRARAAARRAKGGVR